MQSQTIDSRYKACVRSVFCLSYLNNNRNIIETPYCIESIGKEKRIIGKLEHGLLLQPRIPVGMYHIPLHRI